jgi:hypothetical protein
MICECVSIDTVKQFIKTVMGIVLIAAFFFVLTVVLNFAQGTL